MDPITLVVTAVALGASAGLTDTAAQAVKDAYAELKKLLTRRSIDVSQVEKVPNSPGRQTALREDLEVLDGTDKAVDDEVLKAAQTLTDAVAAHNPLTAEAAGVDLERVRAAFLTISSVRADGTGVRVRDGEFTGGITIGQVDSGNPTSRERHDPQKR